MPVASNYNTLGDLKADLYKALDLYSLNGHETDPSDGYLADIQRKLFPAINRAMRKVYQTLYREKKIKDCLRHFEPAQPLAVKIDKSLERGAEQIVSLPQSAYCFSFRAVGTGKATLMMENTAGNSDVVREYAIRASQGKEEYFRDTLPCDTDASGALFPKALQFSSGSDRLCIYDLVFYDKETYLSKAIRGKWIPDYQTVAAEAPSDWLSMVSITDMEGREADPDAFTYQVGYLFTDRAHQGTYRLRYHAQPQVFDENTPEETEIEFPSLLYDAVVFAAASDLCPDTERERYAKLLYRFEEIAANYYSSEILDRSKRNQFYRSNQVGHTIRKGGRA